DPATLEACISVRVGNGCRLQHSLISAVWHRSAASVTSLNSLSLYLLQSTGHCMLTNLLVRTDPLVVADRDWHRRDTEASRHCMFGSFRLVPLSCCLAE